MKLLITKYTCIVLLLASVTCYSQENKNDSLKYVVGGSFSFNTQTNSAAITQLSSPIFFVSTTSETRGLNINFAPYLAKQINSNVLAGIQLTYGFSQFSFPSFRSLPTTGSLEKRITHTFNLGFFTRYNLISGKKFKIFVQPYANIGYGTENSKNEAVLVSDFSQKQIELGASAGIFYDISSRFRALLRIGGLSYVAGNWTNKILSDEQDFNILRTNFSLSNMSFGLEYRF